MTSTTTHFKRRHSHGRRKQGWKSESSKALEATGANIILSRCCLTHFLLYRAGFYVRPQLFPNTFSSVIELALPRWFYRGKTPKWWGKGGREMYPAWVSVSGVAADRAKRYPVHPAWQSSILAARLKLMSVTVVWNNWTGEPCNPCNSLQPMGSERLPEPKS